MKGDIKMEKRLIDLLKKGFLTFEELEEIKCAEEVEKVENCGSSGLRYGYTWFVVKANNEEYFVYVK
jgi:hypothetical protein